MMKHSVSAKFSFSLIQGSGLVLFAMSAVACGGDNFVPLEPSGVGATGGGPMESTGGMAGDGDALVPGASGGASAGDGDVGVDGCAWPSGQAAVSLTYDDAMPTQLSTAVPALKAHGLRATFFLTDVRSNMAPWAALLGDGHELAAHTFNHPCPAASWVPAGNSSQEYDLVRLETELDEQMVMLRELGQPEPFTFAYPCGVTWVGEAQESYVPLISERFLAARGVSGSLAGLAPTMTNVPAFFLEGKTGADMIAQVDAAKAAGSWVVFGFHGIGGDWNVASTESHEELLQYLDDQSDQVFVAPFRDVVQCLTDSSL